MQREEKEDIKEDGREGGKKEPRSSDKREKKRRDEKGWRIRQKCNAEGEKRESEHIYGRLVQPSIHSRNNILTI